MGEHDDLLTRFQPALRYDSNEQFFADDARQYTDAPGIQLRRGGRVLASADTDPKLELSFLGPETYADGTAVDKIDVISVHGKDYRTQYVRLRQARPDLNNRLYGRAVDVNGRTWLQYWAWYFHNDYQLALGFGVHEGDWESVQLRMSPDGDVPDVAVYAQHRHGEWRDWDDVEKLADDPDTPVVYVARGSHAAYFDEGYHETEAFYDLADGRRPAPKLALEIIDDSTHAWMRWPGRWGDTMPRETKLGLEQSSPTGPGTKKHWRNPDSLLDNANPAAPGRTPPRAPDVTIARGKGNQLQVTYDFSARTMRPQALVVTVNSRNEKGVPPKTVTFDEVATRPAGTVTRPDIVLDPRYHYDVYASTSAGDPPKPSASKLTNIDPAGTGKKEPPGARIARWFGRALAKVRRDR